MESNLSQSINRKFTEVAIDYAKAAVADKKRKKHGLLIQQAAKRFLKDLKRTEKDDCPFFFSSAYADDVCEFIEKLPHVEGKWLTPNIILHPAQVFFLVQLFGFRLKDGQEIYDPEADSDWTYYPRRFTSAVFCVARKNAKSTLAAGILIYCLCNEPEPGMQVITAATTFDQAKIVWSIAKKMIDKEFDLKSYYGLETYAKSITRESEGASMKALHSKASTQDGLNPSHAVLDEIHAHKTPDLLNVLTSAAGARPNPLWLMTTTEGYKNPGPWAEIKLFCRQLLSGIFGNSADHYLAVIFSVDETNKEKGIVGDDDFDEKAWIKANPLLDMNPNLLKAIRENAVEAKEMPSKLAEFRIKRLNREASSAQSWINLVKWNICNGPVDLEKLRDVPAFGGLDLSSTMDLSAFRLVWELDGIIYTHGWRWCPQDQVRARTERGTIPYQGWVTEGLIKATPGAVVDFHVVETDLIALNKRFNIKSIGYDPWRATELVGRLMDEDLPMVRFVQGPKSFHPCMEKLEEIYVSGKFHHGGDPVLAWNMSNIIARKDVNMNMAPDKKAAPDKIDDGVALLEAIGMYLGQEKQPAYSVHVI